MKAEWAEKSCVLSTHLSEVLWPSEKQPRQGCPSCFVLVSTCISNLADEHVHVYMCEWINAERNISRKNNFKSEKTNTLRNTQRSRLRTNRGTECTHTNGELLPRQWQFGKDLRNYSGSENEQKSIVWVFVWINRSYVRQQKYFPDSTWHCLGFYWYRYLRLGIILKKKCKGEKCHLDIAQKRAYPHLWNRCQQFMPPQLSRGMVTGCKAFASCGCILLPFQIWL